MNFLMVFDLTGTMLLNAVKLEIIFEVIKSVYCSFVSDSREM